MLWIRVSLIGMTAAAVITAFVFAVWGTAAWVSVLAPPVAAHFIVAGGFVVLAASLVGVLALIGHRAEPKEPPASLPFAFLNQKPNSAQMQLLTKLCEDRPLMALGAAVTLGVLDGLDKRRA